MIYGKYSGKKVEEAKPLAKQDLIDAGGAFVYDEPESVVMSRSGDECIVSLEDQWYLDYGEPKWRAQAEECLQMLDTFNPETKNAFEGVLGWLKNWAVSRTYGLGTKIPWDPKYLVESLSDSTIYQAFYTVSHLLHSDFYGKVVGPLGITAEQMTDDVWDYIFFRTDSVKSDIPDAKLQLLRREFEYFYPMESSISGKDLIPNHLTFYIYTHVALFPKKFWPRGIRCNGHLLLNNAKMSKSTGNFKTLSQLVEKFGADASRIALADGGDTIEDANFDESNANAAILRLYNLKEWIDDMVKNQDSLRTGEYNLFDKLFDNEMNMLIEETYKQYEATYYKAALKTGLFDYQYARDYYREVSSIQGGMHKDLVFRYIESQVTMLAPIAPHFADFVYREKLGHKQSIHTARWPKLTKPVSHADAAALEYIRSLSRTIRETEGLLTKKKKGGKPADLDKTKPAKMTLFVCTTFPDWQEKYVELVRKMFEESRLDDMASIRKEISKQEMKKAMPFINELKKKLTVHKPADVFDRELAFSEFDVVKSSLNILKKSPALVNIEEISVVLYKYGDKVGEDDLSGTKVDIPASKSIDNAVPGQPAVFMHNL
ncbi:unnamed protein product [Ambrosiozyma monospora]|uniref:Unnamed protein product n=1 Tax=Ambrosiozyma monospora TaxID=43982 RepID=A0ACB5T927_AMBMO|nr:unnamed protein product [Ambrosiozyma monospora]